eukprot:scaffold6767_cov223-Isochrysis_galbana.AAC.10
MPAASGSGTPPHIAAERSHSRRAPSRPAVSMSASTPSIPRLDPGIRPLPHSRTHSDRTSDSGACRAMRSAAAAHRVDSRARSAPLERAAGSIRPAVGSAPALARAASASVALASAWRADRAGHRMRAAV